MTVQDKRRRSLAGTALPGLTPRPEQSCGRRGFVRAATNSPPGYDQLAERRFEFIPFWGFLAFDFFDC